MKLNDILNNPESVATFLGIDKNEKVERAILRVIYLEGNPAMKNVATQVSIYFENDTYIQCINVESHENCAVNQQLHETEELSFKLSNIEILGELNEENLLTFEYLG